MLGPQEAVDEDAAEPFERAGRAVRAAAEAEAEALAAFLGGELALRWDSPHG